MKGKRGDGRTDIYAIGVMLYEMLTGKVPFSGPNPFATMNERLLNNPVPPRELDPKNRYAHALEFSQDLQQGSGGVAGRLEQSYRCSDD